MLPLESVGPSILEMRSQSLIWPGTQDCGDDGVPCQLKLKAEVAAALGQTESCLAARDKAQRIANETGCHGPVRT